MLVKTYGSAVHGIDATIVTVEVNVSKGIKFYLVGLPDNAVRKVSSELNRRCGSLVTNGRVRKL